MGAIPHTRSKAPCSIISTMLNAARHAEAVAVAAHINAQQGTQHNEQRGFM
jgi:hypothetical protein